MNNIDPATQSNWEYLFSPDSVAIIGASNTPGTWGFNSMRGLLGNESRRIYPVNPNSPEVLGVKAYKSVLNISDSLDLAVIVVAEKLVPGVLRDCVSKGVKAAVIISSGFGEMGEKGRKLEAELVKIANQGGIRFIGPNSMGHADVRTKLSTFGRVSKLPVGPVSVLSQSGSMCLSIVSNLADSGISCSKYISTGNEADLYMEDYLEYLAEDTDTRIIAAYIEGLRDGRRFLRLAKKITSRKPVVVLKAGGTKESARAVMSHTGALAGADAVYTAAFRQSGVIRVDDNNELCDVVFALLNCPLPQNNRVGILSIGGGPGALTAEACEKEGLVVGKLAESTIRKLDDHLSSRWPRRNPVDMAGASAADLPVVMNLLSALIEDQNIDIIFLHVPLIMPKNTLIRHMGFSPEKAEAYREKEEKKIKSMAEKAEKNGKVLVLIWQMREMMNDPYISSLLKKGKILAQTNANYAAKIMRHLVWYRRYLDATTDKSSPL
ncbi:acetate--CoA ligase family protein [Thermodesulfobacteriota bacterium]